MTETITPATDDVGGALSSTDAISAVFTTAGCAGSLYVEREDPSAALGREADAPVAAVSVIKVLIAVEAQRQFAGGNLDPTRRIRLRTEERTPGPVGFSLYQDDVEVSVRDLLVSMLTLSDNVAADALLDLVGIDSCNQTAAALGMSSTKIVSSLATAIDSIGHAAGFSSWKALVLGAGTQSAEAEAATEIAVRGAPALNPDSATRTTPRDMCRLLRAIWSNEATDPAGCGEIRRLMAQQLTRDRLAAAFPPPAHVAAKSGGLIGILRHEIGTITFPDSRRYFVAVFTRRISDRATPRDINRAIGDAAAKAIDELEDSS